MSIIHRLRAKGLRYWLVSAAILAMLVLAGPLIETRLALQDVRNALFLLLTRSPTNPSTPHQVKLIPIGDDAFWSGAMQHRSPTNRHYLARLISAADQADASVIALDFDLRTSDAARPVHPGDMRAIDPAYRDETDDLMRTIGDVARRRRIVLGKTMEGPVDGPFRLPPESYQAYGMCTVLSGDGSWRNPGTALFPLTPAARNHISCGYIALMDDPRQLPPPAAIVGQHDTVDAFPLAIARARDPAAPDRLRAGTYYASYIPEKALRAPGMAVSATRLLADPAQAAEVLQGFPVIIGAAWHMRAAGEGEVVDVHDTPIGPVVGALLHANLAEAVLDSRTFPALPEWAMLAIEIVLGAACAILFALMRSALLATLVLAAAMPVLLAVQWMALQLFGTFLDLFLPVMGLGLHAITERLRHGARHGG